ncbi:hypothetical protein [Cellvibrio polysaccharolyticus]|uniref:Uncharacterized protein n=1 Tax=Cellvibrio polysaccharolyticus TaxID=2082724 RepID=A0A928V229_9GAMM|nr:hypothetical protein [Cellvibrio polysaccharolyticus]MBE8717353.1 hypothetical protein [Cellvibrio polysaccharolyticus]
MEIIGSFLPDFFSGLNEAACGKHKFSGQQNAVLCVPGGINGKKIEIDSTIFSNFHNQRDLFKSCAMFFVVGAVLLLMTTEQ